MAAAPTAAAPAAALTGRPLPQEVLPAPLCASDGLATGAPPEDVFTWDTVTKRMPKILDSVLASLPASLAKEESLQEGVLALQAEMRDGAPLRPLEVPGSWVGAEAWNAHLAEFLARGESWHSAPWWVVENYMYKRLLQELARCGDKAYDPFEPQKRSALAAATSALDASLRPLLDLITVAEASPPGDAQRRTALEAALVRSLWGNQADLSLSAGKVEISNGPGRLLTDHTATALDLLQGAEGRPLVIVLDNHGLEVLCDLVLVDALLRLTGVSSVTLHVKDAPVFVSDVTEGDVPGILDWLREHEAPLAERLSAALTAGRLRVLASPFYTSARAFWELPPGDLRAAYESAAAVVLKGDANYRRLLGDLHWPYATDFSAYVQSFWPSPGLVALRTMKSGVALGVSAAAQAEAMRAHPKDWLTSGVYGQVLASSSGM